MGNCDCAESEEPYAHTIDFRPKWVNLLAYAGDSLAVRVVLPDPAYAEGCTWLAQVRDERGAASVARQAFLVIPNELDGSAVISLTGTQTADLIVHGTLTEAIEPVMMYCGVWDLQITKAGFEKTLAQGNFTVEEDVSRVVPV